VTSYCDGSKIWEYDLSTFALIGTLPLSQPIIAIQGITWANGKFYIAQDLGTIYSFDYSGQVSPVYSTSIPGSHEGLKYVQGQIRWLIDSGAGLKFIYYISLDSVVVSFPASAAGWILEQSSSLGQPWTPATTGAITTTPGGMSAIFQPPSQNTFYHLRKP
jgi:outer membrane protein assembly factor BamB